MVKYRKTNNKFILNGNANKQRLPVKQSLPLIWRQSGTEHGNMQHTTEEEEKRKRQSKSTKKIKTAMKLRCTVI